ncbi:uncharacterized protein [Pseudochaenichthys georgianus]|uniref:uncharacterized protein n=1 Tax=Pseudochaenichthys georgianus TaxID=52239 RepID=UPI0039C1CFD4
MDYKSSRLSVLDVKMGHTWLCLLGFLLLSLLYRGQAQDAVLTIEPHWTTCFTGESVTFKCDITGGKDSDWFYSIHNRHGEVFSPSNQKFRTLQPLTSGYSSEYQCLFQHGGSTKRSNTIYLTVSDKNVILESPASTLFEGESVTLRCRHRTQREENAAFYRDGSLMAKNTVQVMSDGSSYSCRFGDEESEPITLRTETKPKAQLRDIFPGGGNATLTCSVGLSSASGWRYFWYKKGKTSEPLKTQDVVFLTNDRISVSRGGVYWCRGRRGNPVYYTEYSDAVVTNRAVVTLQPKWPEIYSGEPITLTCEIEDGGDYEWEVCWRPPGSNTSQKSHLAPSSRSGKYQCVGRLKGEMSETLWSDVFTLTVSNERPLPVLSVSPSWLSPGASVTLNCRVDHPSAGWSFYWYKAVPRLSGNSYRYELLPGSENGTEQHLFIIVGQTHTAGYVCRAGRGDPVFYSWYSKLVFVCSGDINSAASLTVSPDSVQHFTKTPVSLNCEGNSTEWRVRRFSKYNNLRHCSSWGTMTGSTCTITRSRFSGVFWCESETGQFSNAVNITKDDGEIILVSPVRPVAEGRPVTLSCKLKTETVYNVDFYKNDKLIQNDTRSELTISAVSKSDEGFYKCKQRDSADGWTSPESWFSVKSASGPGKDSQFPILPIVGLLCGVLLIILLLLLLYLYRKSKDSCYSRSQKTNQGPATDHMINQDETNQREYASVLQDNACLYETVKCPEEPANDESTDVTYSVLKLKHISKKGKSSPAPADETVYSELKPGTALGKNAACSVLLALSKREGSPGRVKKITNNFLFQYYTGRISHKQRNSLSVLDVKMGHTLLCLLGFLLLNLLYRGQAQDAVLTIEPNWTTFFSGGSVTFKCDITGGKDSGWFYSMYKDGQGFLPYGQHESYKLPHLTTDCSGEYQCLFQHGGSTKRSNTIYLNVSDTPQPVLTVSPSWPSPGASVTLNCNVDHPSAGWSFYWYKAVPQKSDYSYSYELLAGSENGTEQHLFIIDGQTHTAGYVCRAGRGDPVFYTSYSKPVFVWSGDLNSATSLTVSPDSVQHFTKTPVSLICEGNSTEWRVRRFSKPDYLLPCSFWGTMTGSTCTITRTSFSGVFWCESETGQFSNAVNITIESERPLPVLTVSPSWLSPGASVTMNCRVDHPSAGWSFYWYKAVPKLSGNSYRYELLPGSENGTEQHLFIIDGQTHTAGYYCRAGTGDPVFYSSYSKRKFVWSGDINSAASLTVSPDSVQHFTKTPVSLSCEGTSTEWRVRRFSKSNNLYSCSSWGTMNGSTCTISRSWLSGVYWCESETGQFSNAVNITMKYGEIILVSPVRPVAEGHAVTLSCKFKTETVLYNVDFYKNDKLIQNDTRSELTISAVSKSDEGFYKCKQRDSADGLTSPESWFSVKSEYGPGTFPVLLIIGLLCGVSLIILLLLFLYLYRKSKDSCYSRSQRTNQCAATDHMINQDETNQREYASVVQDFSSDNACLYETIRDSEEPANDESTDATYSVIELKNISKKGMTNEPEDCVSSHVQMASAAGKSSPAPF